MFITIEGVHFNMDYFSAFGWGCGEVRIITNTGNLSCFSDPDKSLYLQMCAQAGVIPDLSEDEREQKIIQLQKELHEAKSELDAAVRGQETLQKAMAMATKEAGWA